MRVDIEKRHINSYERVIREANKALKKSLKVQKGKYERALLQRDVSVEAKKKSLVKGLHELIIVTFSAGKEKKATGDIKANLGLIRKIIHKTKAINNYLEETLLRELGIIKSSLIIRAFKAKNPEKYLEKSRALPKEYIGKIEHSVYELMQRIIFFDKKLLNGYKKKEVKVISKEKLGIRDLEKILKIESELLDALEAKIPPPSKVKAKLFGKKMFSKWAPMVFALLASFEAEYGKEMLIFSKIKKNNKLRKKVENKIKHVVNEKEKLLKIKEKRALAMKAFKVSDDYRQTFHEYISAASL